MQHSDVPACRRDDQRAHLVNFWSLHVGSGTNMATLLVCLREKTNTFEGETGAGPVGFGGRKRYRLSGRYGDVRGSVAPDHVVAKHIWTVHA